MGKFEVGYGNWAIKENHLMAIRTLDNGTIVSDPFVQFKRNSFAYTTGKDGYLKHLGIHQAKIDYSEFAGGELWMEPSVTNLVTYSNNLSKWNPVQSTIKNSGVMGPDKSMSATTLVATAGSGEHYIESNSFTVTSGEPYNASVFLKYNSNNIVSVALIAMDGSEVVRTQNIDLTTGITTESAPVEHADSWFRVFAAGISGYTGTAKIVVKLLNDRFESDFVATGSESVEVGFTQATNTTELMSYVETDSTSVAKVADVCYDGGLKYGFTGPEGYFVVTMRTSEEYEGLQVIELGDKTYNNRLAMSLSGSLNRVQWVCSIGGTQLTGYQQFGVNCSEIHEVGISHNKGFTLVMYVDGVNVNSSVAIDTDLTCTLTQLKAGSGSNHFEGRIRGFKYFDNLAQAKEEYSYLIDQ